MAARSVSEPPGSGSAFDAAGSGTPPIAIVHEPEVARALAQRIVDALSTVDVDVPVLGEMRRLAEAPER